MFNTLTTILGNWGKSSRTSRRRLVTHRLASEQLELRLMMTADIGSPDVTFGTGGLQRVGPNGFQRSSSPIDIALVPNGTVFGFAEYSRPITGGFQVVDLVYARDSSGARKTSFDGDGFLNPVGYLPANLRPHFRIEAIAVQPDGKIVIGGSTGSPPLPWIGPSAPAPAQGDFVFLRVNANGTLDTTFGVGGSRVVDGSYNDFDLTSIVIRNGGYILAVGTSQTGAGPELAAVMQLTDDGNPDPFFGDIVGQGLNLSAYNIRPQRVIFDSVFNRIFVVSNQDVVGSDPSPTPPYNPDVQIVVQGFFPEGLEDNLFGGGDALVEVGKVGMIAHVQSATISGNWIYVAGYQYDKDTFESEDFVARFSRGQGHPTIPKGVWDQDFGDGGFLFVDQVNLSILDAAAGGFYLAGDPGDPTVEDPENAMAVAKYNSVGTLDTSFGQLGMGRIPIPSIALSESRMLRDGAGNLVFARDINLGAGVGYQLHIARFVASTNDAPVIGAFGGSVNYTENGAATILDSNATIVDLDSTDLGTGKLTVAIIGNSEATDRVGIRHVGNLAGQIGVSGTTVSYGGVAIGTFTGTTKLIVNLNSSATPAAVQALLRKIKFSTVSDTPSTLDRTVKVTLTDGDGGTSNTPTKVVKVAAANDAPVIGAFEGFVNYTENGAAAILDSNATIVDPDSTNLETGNLTVAIIENSQATDRLGIRHVGNLAGQIGVSGTTVSYGGIPIGTFAGTIKLTVTLNSSATPAAVQALLRKITYFTVSDTPSTLDRTVKVTLTDGDGGISNSPTKLVKVAEALRWAQMPFKAHSLFTDLDLGFEMGLVENDLLTVR